ncbi:unnamed protein product [Moneuplotes crassus]|uniref:Uncharacterized protein n=1 Tax=Euplotes crassus TaxID=5936 RepID=A0AAD1XFL1_EUPCR|nr:unnamed protein product [Moneuplotes crassus]
MKPVANTSFSDYSNSIFKQDYEPGEGAYLYEIIKKKSISSDIKKHILMHGKCFSKFPKFSKSKVQGDRFSKTLRFLRDSSVPAESLRMRDSKEKFKISTLFDPFQTERSWKQMKISPTKIRDLHTKAGLCITPQSKCISALGTPMNVSSYQNEIDHRLEKARIFKFNFDKEILSKSPKKINLQNIKVKFKNKELRSESKVTPNSMLRYRCSRFNKKKFSLPQNFSDASKMKKKILADQSFDSLRIDSHCRIKTKAAISRTFHKRPNKSHKKKTLNLDLRDICMNYSNG